MVVNYYCSYRWLRTYDTIIRVRLSDLEARKSEDDLKDECLCRKWSNSILFLYAALACECECDLILQWYDNLVRGVHTIIIVQYLV